MLASTFFLGLILVVTLFIIRKQLKSALSAKKLENCRKRKKRLLEKNGKTNKEVTKINFKFLNQL